MKTSKAILKETSGKGMIEMKTLRTFFVIMLVLIFAAGAVYADPGGNGQGRGPKEPKEKKPNTHQQSNEKRSHAVERGRKDADIRANLPETANGNARMIGHGRKDEKAKADPNEVLASLEKSRWSYNPHDERGQGNMGKPDMRDPFGHDKDSGREGSERGRPIREDEAWTVAIDFYLIDVYLYSYMKGYERYSYLAQLYPQNTLYARLASYYANLLNTYTPNGRIAVNSTGNTINYNLTFTSSDKLEGTTLYVTTTLISKYDYTFKSWYTNIHYDAGQVIMEQTQEVVLGADDTTFSYSYDPPNNIIGNTGMYADFNVTVTDEKGTSYSMPYTDTQLYLYRCPYGKVTNAKSGEPIVGAKVTVHFEDGSIVPLDKASNPTANNPQATDATGRYGFKLETNRKYYITAKAPSYEDYKSEVFTEKWHVLREDIAMTPVEELALNAE